MSESKHIFKPGVKLTNKFIPNAIIEVEAVDDENNRLDVRITKRHSETWWTEEWLLDASFESIRNGTYKLMDGYG